MVAPRSGDRRHGGSLAVVCVGAVAILAAGAPPAVADTPLELAVKATFLYKFAPFVDWPAAALGPPGSPMAICVVGKDPFDGLLDRAVAGQRLGDHPLVVRRMAVATPKAPCPIMFVGGSTAQPVREALRLEEGTPVLTITDESATPGVIDFVVDDGRVRFRIDDRAAAGNGLTIRAQLLNLATSVTPRRSSR